MSSKGMYIVGITGFIMLIVATILMEPLPAYLGGVLTYIMLWVIFSVGIVLGSFTFFGFYKDHGSKFGLVVFIISLVFPWFLLSSVILDFILGYSLIVEIFFVLGLVFLGVVFLLWGSAMLVARKEFRQPELLLVAGILFMLESVSYFYLSPYGYLYMIPACMVSVIALFTSEGVK